MAKCDENKIKARAQFSHLFHPSFGSVLGFHTTELVFTTLNTVPSFVIIIFDFFLYLKPTL